MSYWIGCKILNKDQPDNRYAELSLFVAFTKKTVLALSNNRNSEKFNADEHGLEYLKENGYYINQYVCLNNKKASMDHEDKENLHTF